MSEWHRGPVHINITQHTAVAVAVAAGAGFAVGCLLVASFSSRSGRAGPSRQPSAIRTPRYTEESESEPGTPRTGVSEDPGYLKMVLCVNQAPDMGAGKTAQQCAHAAVCQFKKLHKRRDTVLFRWDQGGSPKVCVGVESEAALFELRRIAQARGLPTFAVEAEGVKTVLAIGPAQGGSVDSVVGHLQLLP